ncbi:uncharacterized protein LOC124294944 [Neodiprion lecontei]|uniref:Uncharacterized protein LOC124294944 n=1 Tax=Neodiprion lecontei TaxID=441921 RepID=A0ABM3GE46_NEOLC|nr:uncharacterized protein LOC124294944 [Neodiprion lecontei]
MATSKRILMYCPVDWPSRITRRLNSIVATKLGGSVVRLFQKQKNRDIDVASASIAAAKNRLDLLSGWSSKLRTRYLDGCGLLEISARREWDSPSVIDFAHDENYDNIAIEAISLLFTARKKKKSIIRDRTFIIHYCQD